MDCCTAEFRLSSQPDLGLLGVNSGRVRLIGVGLEGVDSSGSVVAPRTTGIGASSSLPRVLAEARS
jgi:hypothetical protein